jgi:hypothetical protein
VRGGERDADNQRRITITKKARTRDCRSAFGNSPTPGYGRDRKGAWNVGSLLGAAAVVSAFRESPLLRPTRAAKQVTGTEKKKRLRLKRVG